MSRASPPCELLEWDTNFFGFRIGRLRGNTLTESKIKQAETWSACNRIRCLYFLAHPDDMLTTRLAEEHGFQLVDLRLTFECKITAPLLSMVDFLHPLLPEEMPALERLARAGFTHSRFFHDTGFPRERAEALYEVWIKRDFQDPSSIVLVAASAGGSPHGFISCRLEPGQEVASVGLIGVSAEGRGKGTGKALLNGALTWAGEHGATRLEVVTQGRNIAAQRLYQRGGFLIRFLELWYHKWYDINETQNG